jgi:hypothetical protein
LINYIVNKYEVQLALIGNKNKIKGTGAVSGKLLRLLKCNILSIPKSAKPIISKIWAGTDFSNASHKVLMYVQKATDDSQKSIHVYNVPIQSIHSKRAP